MCVCVCVRVLATVLLHWTSVSRSFWSGSEVSHWAESLSAAHCSPKVGLQASEIFRGPNERPWSMVTFGIMPTTEVAIPVGRGKEEITEAYSAYTGTISKVMFYCFTIISV